MASLTELSGLELEQLSPDQLGLIVLDHLAATDEGNSDNFLLTEAQRRNNDPLSVLMLTEAIGWLRSNNLIAHPKPGQSSPHSMIVTRAGRQALADGVATLKAGRRLSFDLHDRLGRARSQFLQGEFELAAFAALKEVEIRVRELSGEDDAMIGRPLMTKAFGLTGRLRDPGIDQGEANGIMELFAGSIGTFKNPTSHRQVTYSDATEASEIVLLADLLMRMLDRTEARLKSTE